MVNFLKTVVGMCFITTMLSACSGFYPKPEPLCGERVINRCGSCNPREEQVVRLEPRFDKTLITKAKDCVIASTDASIQGTPMFDGSLTACITKDITVQEKTLGSFIRLIESTAIPDAAFQQWVNCAFNRELRVAVLDSTLDNLVYCPSAGRANYDVIKQLIRDRTTGINIDVRSYDTTGNSRDHSADVRSWKPDLVIIHASAFYDNTTSFKNNDELRSFLRDMKDIPGKVLVYSRGVEEPRGKDKDEWIDLLQKLYAPEIKEKVELFLFDDYRKACFTSNREFKNKLNDMLDELIRVRN